MEFYADSSFLVALSKRGDHFAEANRYMVRHMPALPFNPWHRLEVRNAFRLGLKRGEMNAEEVKAALAQIDADLREQLLIHTAINWPECLRRAEALSAAHTETLGSRAMDILHVAIALEDGAQTFLSFDANQRALAAAEGLTVQP